MFFLQQLTGRAVARPRIDGSAGTLQGPRAPELLLAARGRRSRWSRRARPCEVARQPEAAGQPKSGCSSALPRSTLALRAEAACTVFASSIAIVIGPTPP